MVFLTNLPFLPHLTIDSAQHLCQIRDALEAGALVNWMTFYGPVKNKNLIYGVLRKLPSLEERLNTAVDLTMGNTLVRLVHGI